MITSKQLIDALTAAGIICDSMDDLIRCTKFASAVAEYTRKSTPLDSERIDDLQKLADVSNGPVSIVRTADGYSVSPVRGGGAPVAMYPTLREAIDKCEY